MALPECNTHIEEDIPERCDDLWNFTFPVRNQEYVVMMMIEATEKHPPAIKVFGTFPTISEANDMAQKISNECDFFNVYTAQTQAWLPCPPSPKFIEDVQYQESKLNDMKNMYAKMKERDAVNLRNQIKRDENKKEDGLNNQIKKEDEDESMKMAKEDINVYETE